MSSFIDFEKLAKKYGPKAKKVIEQKMRKMKNEDMPQEQKAAIAIEEARRKGLKVPKKPAYNLPNNTKFSQQSNSDLSEQPKGNSLTEEQKKQLSLFLQQGLTYPQAFEQVMRLSLIPSNLNQSKPSENSKIPLNKLNSFLNYKVADYLDWKYNFIRKNSSVNMEVINSIFLKIAEIENQSKSFLEAIKKMSEQAESYKNILKPTDPESKNKKRIIDDFIQKAQLAAKQVVSPMGQEVFKRVRNDFANLLLKINPDLMDMEKGNKPNINKPLEE